MSTLKVCLIAPEFFPVWGGVGTYCIELSKALCEKVDVHVVTLTRKEMGKEKYSVEEIMSFFNGKIDLHIVTKASVRDTFVYNARLQMAVYRKLPRLMNEHHFDIIHSNFPAMPDILLKFKGWRGPPSLATVHTSIEMLREGTRRSRKNIKDMENSERMTLLLSPYLYLCQSLYLSKSKNLVFVSDYIKNLVSSKYNLTSDNHLIHMGINTNDFSPTKIKEFDYSFPQLVDVNPIVLFVGRFTALKGIHLLIKAMKEVLSRNREVHFVFAGHGNVGLLSNMKRNQIPSNRYSMLGYVERSNLPSLYARSSIFVLPSYIESCPLSVLEAMSTETLVITNNVGGVPEIIDNDVNGILLQPGDHKILAEKILFFLENERLIEKIARKARRKVVNNFTVQKLAEKTIDVYKDIISGK